MSPSKGTPRQAFRIPPPLLAEAKAKAAREHTTLTAVIVAALVAYAEGDALIHAYAPGPSAACGARGLNLEITTYPDRVTCPNCPRGHLT